MKKAKLYLETSVWNFYYADDAPEKKDITREFFNNIEKGLYDIFVSQIVFNEFARADEIKRKELSILIDKIIPTELPITEEVIELANRYIDACAIPKKKLEDATHAAVASVYNLDALISWNYRHLASMRKEEIINGINLQYGYNKHIRIITPWEVICV